LTSTLGVNSEDELTSHESAVGVPNKPNILPARPISPNVDENSGPSTFSEESSSSPFDDADELVIEVSSGAASSAMSGTLLDACNGAGSGRRRKISQMMQPAAQISIFVAS
jgi:hypothetical protein